MTSRYESISDDALFGSGTDSWNNTTDTSSQLTNENILDNMTLQNTDDSRNTRRSNGRSSQQQVLHQIPGSSQTSDEIIQPVYDPSTIIQSTNLRQEPVEDMGARAKVLKNNENRTKNGTKKSQHVKNGENKVVPRKFRPQDFQTTNSNWEPKLQLKKQDNSIDDEDETVLLKLANDDRHSRRKKTQNTPKSRSAPLTSSLTNSFSDNDMLSYDSIPIPAGLNPNLQQSDFQNRIYIKRSNSARTNVPNSRSDQISNLQLENQGNGNDDIFSTNQPQNVTIYNNLWEEQPRGKKQTKEENTRAGSGISVLHLNQPKNLAAVHVVNNDLEADMDPQHPAINVSNCRSLGRTNSRSRLDNPIVVPYESESKTEHTLNMDNLPCITQATPCDNIQTMNFNSSPNSLTNSSVVGEFQNSLPSDLSSNVLFGEGNSLNDQDFLFAQQLQRKYDREDEEFRQRHFDLPVHRFGVSERPSLNKQRNQHSHCRHEESSEQLVNDRNSPCGHDIDSLSTSDFVTAFPLDEDNINGTVPVYAPENNTNHSPDPIVIPYENERTSEHNDNVSGLEEVSANEPTILTIPYETLSPRLQNDESYHEIAGVQEDIHIPFDEAFTSSDLSLPPVELPGNNMVARGTGSTWQPQENQQTTSGNNTVARGTGSRWQPHEDHQTTAGNNVVARETRSPWQQDSTQTLDLEYARQIQEQEDEVLARRLQEEDERRSQSHFIARRNNRRTAPRHHRRSEPLHQRFSDTWTSRPLIVSPGALNNNVADSHTRPYLSSERPLVTGSGNEFSYLDNVHTLPVNEGYDIAPGPDYYYRYEHDPDYMLDEHGEDRLISINRDPQLLATLLMTRDPDMMIPNDLDLNNYEALWELAEHLGEVRRVGMDPKDIALLPVHEHKTETKTEKKDDTTFDCSVCMSEFKSGEKLKTLPCCHIYHVDCIDEWLKRNAVCPVCRRSAKQGNN